MVNLDESSGSGNTSSHNLMLSPLSSNLKNRPAPYADLPPPPINPQLDDIFGDDESETDATSLRL
jgi:hypothetical protein